MNFGQFRSVSVIRLQFMMHTAVLFQKRSVQTLHRVLAKRRQKMPQMASLSYIPFCYSLRFFQNYIQFRTCQHIKDSTRDTAEYDPPCIFVQVHNITVWIIHKGSISDPINIKARHKKYQQSLSQRQSSIGCIYVLPKERMLTPKSMVSYIFMHCWMA